MKFMHGNKGVSLLVSLAALVLTLAVFLTGCSQQAAPAKEEYPTKPIQNIVPWAAGGAVDMSQRLTANFMPKYFGQSMVVVNKTGGAAVPGTAEVAKAKPDGYTIGMNTYGSFVLRPHLVDVPYKIDDYTYIMGMVRQRLVLAVKADSQFSTLQDLVDYAKKNPNQLKFSGCPTASLQHLVGMDFNQKAGTQSQFVPYDGGRPSAVALIGGHLDYIVVQPLEIINEVRSGQIRILAALEKTRIPNLPDVPTASELGIPVAHPHMMIIIGPAGMPEDKVKKIHDAYRAIMEDPEFQKMAKDAGLEIEYKPGEEVKKEIVEMNRMYKELVPKVLNK
ncbi:tripartite tricarboxylate transporter substrate binding protein [Sporomusa termitida]|uniref:Tripartite tricarboxylate transporter family receptor n=1 Tax=Sporomusa termitida TaxID=2377 RepID=A0A517E1A8_9FIRM|nr:tripartite tricarboxylate transporter substrate binding protein [Sporomusa termitida]QDR83391.1 Tripartite tricarboxylate transporter family receptor [Sporomusa termitida]